MIRTYRLSPADLAELAAGGGRPAVLDVLVSAQVSKHLLLFREVVRAAGRPGSVEPALAVLGAVQERSPAVITDLFADAWTGSWSIRSLLALREGGPADLAHLDALAATAAIRAGVDADLTIAVRDGLAHLPTLGAARVSGPTARIRVRSGRAELRADGVTLTVPEDSRAIHPDWLPLRRLVGTPDGPALTVALADLGPYRDCYRMTLAGRLTDAEVSTWQGFWVEATRLLNRHAPSRVPELARGLQAVVPLADSEGMPGLSATSRDAFGAFALTRPEGAASLAVTMVHEYQHAKLSALLDLLPLHHKSDGTRYFAPWRPDPRPIGGLLQGTYAFLGVADTWRRLRAEPGLGELAERQFAEVREQLAVAVDALAEAAELTDEGRRFADGIRDAVGALMDEALPGAVTRAARAALLANREAWEERRGATATRRLT